MRCPDCTHEIPSSLDHCPNCYSGTLRFPNVDHAQEPREVDALDRRYNEAKTRASSRGAGTVVRDFENIIDNASCAVIVVPLWNILRLANSDKQLYSSFYSLVDAGMRIPDNNKWDHFRGDVDSKLFKHYREHIRFAALSLNGLGMLSYANSNPSGAWSLVLFDPMIKRRASVFEENSMVFMDKHNTKVMRDTPCGYRATWEHRAKLAVAKVADKIDASTQYSDFATLLLEDRNDPYQDQFIEVHIYGSISVLALKEVVIKVPSSLTRQLFRWCRFRLTQLVATLMLSRGEQRQLVFAETVMEQLSQYNVPCRLV